MHPNFYLYDPQRPPAWRFDRVLSLIEGQDVPRRPARLDDAHIRTYWKFLMDYRAAERNAQEEIHGTQRGIEDSVALTRLFSRKAALWYAHQIQFSPNTECRATLQARILAREDDDYIATTYGTLPEAVQWYEAIFFNVRDRLDARGYIVQTILGTWASRRPENSGAWTEAQRDLVYKIFAYHGGTYALEAVISGFQNVGHVQRSGDVESWFEQTLKHMVKVRATTAMQTFEMNKYNVMQLFDLCFRVLETEQTAGNDEKRRTALEDAFAHMLKEIPWQLALRGRDKLSPLQQKFSGALEPRAEEQLLIASGQASTELLQYNDRVNAQVAEPAAAAAVAT